MNTNEHEENGMTRESGTTRREILKSVGRYGALLGLLGGVGVLAGRTACGQGACAGCPLLARCDLSKAQEVRAGGRGGGAENRGRS